MGILRVEKNSNYSVISNVHLQDTSLSWKAKGVLSYLLSKRDDWQIYLAHMQKQSTDGRDATRSGINELIDAGYITRDYSRNESGHIVGRDYIVREQPVVRIPTSETPKTENPTTVNPTVINTDIINNGLQSKIENDDVRPAPQQTPPDQLPTVPPPPSPCIESKKPKQPDTPAKQVASVETALAALVLLIPEDMRKPSTVARVAQAIKEGIAIATIKEAILFTNDKSDRKTWGRYKSHMGNCIDKGWSEGYEGAGPEDAAAIDKAALQGRLEMSTDWLKMDAAKGDKYSAKALEIKLKKQE